MFDFRRLTLPGGLRLVAADPAAALRAGVAAVLAVCVLVPALDLAFRASLPPEYLEQYTAPLWPRMAVSSLAAMGEELLYRLGLMTALAAVPSLWGKIPGPRWMVAAIVLAQWVNIGVLGFAVMPWGLLRFGLVGCIWGWLYWRHGFGTALIAHGSVHLLLDPLLLGALGGSFYSPS